tara:strand:+ start:498 stop:692 length:195 start_codon:yes stop_codon:yes gene_type:complete
MKNLNRHNNFNSKDLIEHLKSKIDYHQDCLKQLDESDYTIIYGKYYNEHKGACEALQEVLSQMV